MRAGNGTPDQPLNQGARPATRAAPHFAFLTSCGRHRMDPGITSSGGNSVGKMKRPVVVSALAAAQFVSGCAAQQTWLVPGDDPDKLVAAIAKQGQSHAPSEAAPPDSSVVADVVTTGAKVG